MVILKNIEKMRMVMVKVHMKIKNLGQGMMKRREGGVVGGSVDVSSSLWRGKVFPLIVGYYFAMRSITFSNLLNILY